MKFNLMNVDLKTFWKDKKVLVTGNTGFKGSWMSYLLNKLGANIVGYSLKPQSSPSLFQKLDFDNETFYYDIRDFSSLKGIVEKIKPEIVFHLAAQPIVIESYKKPIDTFEININGTINLLEALKDSKKLRSVIIVTTDKVYENKEWMYGYREIDNLGGFDPYSASKACVEIITSAYRDSYYKDKKIKLSSARAGNVIGGGDWAEYRLIPDIVRSIYEGHPLNIRYPKSTRPWQHVLDPVLGYLELARLTFLNESVEDGAYNFGPLPNSDSSVEQIINEFLKNHNSRNIKIKFDQKINLHEANALSLNIEKSINNLNWSPKLNTNKALELTANWYDGFYKGASSKVLIDNDVDYFLSL